MQGGLSVLERIPEQLPHPVSHVTDHLRHGANKKPASIFIDLVVELPGRALAALAHDPGATPGADALLPGCLARRTLEAVMLATFYNRLDGMNDGRNFLPCLSAGRFPAAGAVVVEPQNGCMPADHLLNKREQGCYLAVVAVVQISAACSGLAAVNDHQRNLLAAHKIKQS